MPQTPVDNTQPSLALTQSLVINGVFPSMDDPAGRVFMGEIFTYAFDFSPPGATHAADGMPLPINQYSAKPVFMCRWPPEAGTLRCPRSSSPPSVPVPAPAA